MRVIAQAGLVRSFLFFSALDLFLSTKAVTRVPHLQPVKYRTWRFRGKKKNWSRAIRNIKKCPTFKHGPPSSIVPFSLSRKRALENDQPHHLCDTYILPVSLLCCCTYILRIVMLLFFFSATSGGGGRGVACRIWFTRAAAPTGRCFSLVPHRTASTRESPPHTSAEPP